MNFDFKNLMNQARDMQENMKKVQEHVRAQTVSAESGAGLVKVQVSGDMKVRSLTIDPSILTPDKAQVVQDLVVAALNSALNDAQEMMKSEMQKITPSIPGMSFPFGS